jgi:hypothetical protein
METHDQYNQPGWFYNFIDNCYNDIWPELKPYRAHCQFIYAGHHSDYIIHRWRTDESVLSQIAEAHNAEQYNIFFECAAEGIGNDNILTVHNIVAQALMQFPKCRFFFITAEVNGQNSYEELCKHWNKAPILKVITCYLPECSVKQGQGFFGPTPSYTPALKNKKYTCLNRVLRMHRIKLLDKLLALGLVNDECYYSFHDNTHTDGGITQLYNHGIADFPNVESNIELVKTLRLNLDPERLNPCDLRVEDLPLYDEAYFSVVTETVYEEVRMQKGCIFFSEKTYKPMAMMHPFILVNNIKSLEALHKRGFRTFHPFIDESYDTIEDGDERLNAIVSEIKRLCEQTPEQWLQWCENIKPIVEHNYQRLRNGSNYITEPNLISHLYIPV